MSLEEVLISLDLDSTLCDTTHRQHMINRGGYTDWEAYSLACVDDGPGPALPLAQYLSLINAPFVICSARSGIARPQTQKWLHDRGVNPWGLFMLDENDHDGLGHGAWKAQRLVKISKLFNREIAFHMDDWDISAETEAVGIPTILVHAPGAFVGVLG